MLAEQEGMQQRRAARRRTAGADPVRHLPGHTQGVGLGGFIGRHVRQSQGAGVVALMHPVNDILGDRALEDCVRTLGGNRA